MQETWFDPWIGKTSLEQEMATPSSILAWKIPWTEEPGGLPVHGVAPSNTPEQLSMQTASKT